MNFKEKYQELNSKVSDLEKKLEEYNKKHAQDIADSCTNKILDIEGVEGIRILESGSPECRMDRNIKICVKLTEGAQEPNKVYQGQEGEYFSFHHSGIPQKIKNILGEEYKDTPGLHITDSWELGKPSYWEELILERVTTQ